MGHLAPPLRAAVAKSVSSEFTALFSLKPSSKSAPDVARATCCTVLIVLALFQVCVRGVDTRFRGMHMPITVACNAFVAWQPQPTSISMVAICDHRDRQVLVLRVCYLSEGITKA